MEYMSGLEALTRWLHVLAGIIWIGHLYFFNFVNGPFAATMDAATKQKVVPELMPRALWFFRMGAAWTWVTGFLLLLLVYYHGKQATADGLFTPAAWFMVAVTFLGVFLYDAIWKSPLGKNVRAATAVSFLLLAVVVGLYACPKVGNFSYRGMLIHTGVLFGTIMVANVWTKIWPAQQKFIAAVKAGQAPDAALVALAGQRSRHNTYLSVPLVWTMIGQHTTFFAGGNLGIPENWAWVVWLVIILLGWHIVFQLYKRAGKVKGF
jgi:uncharacterized membrane protein